MGLHSLIQSIIGLAIVISLVTVAVRIESLVDATHDVAMQVSECEILNQ